MKNNSTVAILLILVLGMIIIYPLVKIQVLPLLIENNLAFSDLTFKNITVSAMYIINLSLLLIVVLTIIILIFAFKKWNNLKYYELSIIRKLDIVAYLFIGEGILVFYSLFFTSQSEIFQNKITQTLKIDPFFGIMLIIIGLMFALITSILTNAKLVKEENDLTI